MTENNVDSHKNPHTQTEKLIRGTLPSYAIRHEAFFPWKTKTKRLTLRARAPHYNHKISYFYIVAESARLVRPWPLRTSHLDTASFHYFGPAFFGFFLHVFLL